MAFNAQDFLEPARELGFGFWTGVPCSYLKPFINYIIDAEGLTYVPSANEGDAVATASGAALGGQKSVVMMQNSGLGNAVSPLSSLNWVYRIPVLIIVTLRGEAGVPDEPQHELMGRVTARLLETLDIAWDWLPDSAARLEDALASANGHMDRTGRPFAFIMRKGSVQEYRLRSGPLPATQGSLSGSGAGRPRNGLPTRREVLERVVGATGEADSVVIGTTGYTGRELFAVEDRPNHLYLVGAMGCASSLGLGLSMARRDLKVVVADGDGAALMRMGNLATIGAMAGERLLHLLLDNGMYESTGGQATVSRSVDFPAVARACGYRSAGTAARLEDIDAFLATVDGPAFLHAAVAPMENGTLPRPDISPATVKRRLMAHLGSDLPWSGTGA